MKTAEDYFKERFSEAYYDDRFSKKTHRFDFYDMIDFAEQYASLFQPPVEEGEKQTDIFNEMFSLYFRLIHQEQMSEYDTVNDLKEKYTITRKP